MKIRLATAADIDAVSAIYDAIHDEEELGEVSIGWKRGIYPTRDTAKAALEKGELYVAEMGGKIVASAILNGEEVDVYSQASWQYRPKPDEIAVLHTLTVDPAIKRGGIGASFVDFYETWAQKSGRAYLRLDTNAKNKRAREMYNKRGYKEAGIVDTTFNGIEGVALVVLEKKL